MSKPKPWPLWLVVTLRAVISATVTALITFLPLHDALFGFRVFAMFTLLSGVVMVVSARYSMTDSTTRYFVFGQGMLGVVAGGSALYLQHWSQAILLALITLWAILSGILELYGGLRLPKGDTQKNDLVFVGALTLVLGLAFLLQSPDSVLQIGLFGLYSAIVAVYLAIAGFSMRPQKAQSAVEGK